MNQEEIRRFLESISETKNKINGATNDHYRVNRRRETKKEIIKSIEELMEEIGGLNKKEKTLEEKLDEIVKEISRMERSDFDYAKIDLVRKLKNMGREIKDYEKVTKEKNKLEKDKNTLDSAVKTLQTENQELREKVESYERKMKKSGTKRVVVKLEEEKTE